MKARHATILFTLFFKLQIAHAVPSDTIPVVVHVIHTGTPIGSPDNPTDASIASMIGLMNDAFQKNGVLYGGANVNLAFGLAVRSPNCASATGINRVDGSDLENYETGGITTDTTFYPNSAHELFVKELSRWPNTDYINIWLVNMIDGNPLGSAGYAYFPEYNSALLDGIVLRSDVVGSTDKTIIHELGHYLFLEHTFGISWVSCMPETDCMTDGDFLCDTENCRYTLDCNETINPCTGNPYVIADVDHNYTVLHNYMGYTGCTWMFTEDQKDRMLSALDEFRPGLKSSSALKLPPDEIAIAACMPAAVNGLSPYYGIQKVVVGDFSLYSNTSKEDGHFYIDRTCNQTILLNAAMNIPVEITGSYQNFQWLKIYLDLNNDGEFDLPGEVLLAGEGGTLSGTISLSDPSMKFCQPLRMRVVSDHPAAPEPTACLLTGTPEDGVGQIEDYTVIIKPRQVESLASGNWNDPATWSCNCIPSFLDALLIHSNHIITVPLSLGMVTCASIRLEPGALLNAVANVDVKGGCDQ